jgi:hypothetical protein
MAGFPSWSNKELEDPQQVGERTDDVYFLG